MERGGKRRDPGTKAAVIALLICYGSFTRGMLVGGEMPAPQVPHRAIDKLPAGVRIQTEFSAASEIARSGAIVYERYCSGCHGATGAGDGPAAAWLDPKPRNFATGIFKFTSSAPGTLPNDSDLMRTITEGLPGSSMPSFRLLSEDDRRSLVAYILHLARNARVWRVYQALVVEAIEGADESEPFNQRALDQLLVDNKSILGVREAQAIFPGSAETALDKASLLRGARKYSQYCHSCHAADGRGLPMLKTDGSGPQLDEFGEASRPRDLTQGHFRHGRTALDIWYRIKRGLDGAVMPAAGDWSSDEAWDVAHYVQYLFSPELRQRFPLAEIDAKQR